MKTRDSAASIAMAVLLAGMACGEGERREAGTESSSPVETDTLVLALADTIGVEMGDSAYVFGMIMEAGHSSSGEIVVLDMQRACLSVYSADGVFLRNIGAPGPGPGEFQFPMNFALMSDGGFAVSDAIARNISFFDPNGNYTGMMQGFFPTPPMNIEGGPDDTFVGESMLMVMMDQEMEASLKVSRWSDSTEADLTYYSRPMDLNLGGDGGQATVQRGPEIDFAVGPDGSVFVAEISDTLFSVKGFGPDGQEFLSMVEPFDRTPISQEELDAGSLSLSIQIVDGEASSSVDRDPDVYPYRNVISSIGVDGESRVWVEMGNGDSPLFRVYDYSGNLLFHAVTDVPFTPVTRPDFMIDAGGYLACDRDPLDYPKVFTFRLEEGS